MLERVPAQKVLKQLLGHEPQLAHPLYELKQQTATRTMKKVASRDIGGRLYIDLQSISENNY